MTDNEQTKKNWLNVNVSQDALIRKLDKVTVFRMPNDSEYAGNTYLIFNNRVKSATQIVDMKSDDRELSFRLTIPEGDII